MSYSHVILLLLLGSSLFYPVRVSGQQTTRAKSAQTLDAELQQKAFNLLESLAVQISGLQSAENRARIGSNIVGSLWSHDEKRARSLLALVAEDIRVGLREVPDDPQNAHTIMVFLRLREDTAERVAKYDPEAALAFLKATEVKLEKSPRGADEREQALALRLGKLAALKNPDVALELGRQSLGRGLSHELLPLLRQLFRSHRDHGRILHKEIVGKLRGVNFATDWSKLYFSKTLVHSFTPPLVEESAFRDLINIFISNAAANKCDNKRMNERVYLCREIGELVPQIEQVDPSRAAQLKHLAPTEVDRGFTPEAYYELNNVAQDGDVDEILALAVKYPQIAKEIVWRAVWKAEIAGDLERARKIASDYVADPEQRKAILEHVNRNEKWAAMSEEAFAEAMQKLNTISPPIDRIEFLVGLAQNVGAQDRNRALQLLNQAQGIAETMPDGSDKMKVMIGLAMLLCFEKSDRGFAMMESVVPKMNALIDAAAKLDGFDTRYLRDGEWNMSAEGNLGELLTGLAQNAGYFAWSDFDRAVNLASQFDRNEIRLMAQLKLAQAILAGPPTRRLVAPRVEY